MEVPQNQKIVLPPKNPNSSLMCTTCKWFKVGYNGATCQVTRLVNTTTAACIEHVPYRASPYDILYTDKYLRGLVEKVGNIPALEKSLKAFLDEVKEYRLYGSDTTNFKVKAYIEYATEEKMTEIGNGFEYIQAMQERVVDILAEIFEIHQKLELCLYECDAYLMKTYTELISNAKNEAERKNIRMIAVPELVKALKLCEGTTTRLEKVSESLKNAHFSLSRTQDSAIKIWELRTASISSMGRRNG